MIPTLFMIPSTGLLLMMEKNGTYDCCFIGDIKLESFYVVFSITSQIKCFIQSCLIDIDSYHPDIFI